MATQPGNMVKLETIIRMETTSSDELAILVLVTAPPELHTEHSDADTHGVDLVAVLDASGRMNEDNRLQRMKEAMLSVIDQLSPDDRLCILSFNDEVLQHTELCRMSDEDWDNARAEVEELTAPAGGGANVMAATEAAAMILAQRGKGEQCDRVGRVIFLSGGDEDADPGQNTNSSPELAVAPVAFVLGADDNLSALSFSADDTSGAYSYVKQDVDKMKDEPGFMSADTAIGVQIDLHSQEGVAISSIESGSHRVSVGPDGPRSLTIYIQDLYAGEQKSFTVHLTVSEGKEELLAVTGRYMDPLSGEDVRLGVCAVSVPRPNEATPVDEAVYRPQVAAELDGIEEKKVNIHPDTLDIPGKEEAIPDKNQSLLAAVPEQVDIPAKQRVSKKLSWLSGMFAAVWSLVAKQADNFKKDPERKFGKAKVIWSWARNNPYACALALLLLGATMLLMSQKMEDNWKKNSSLNISQHPGWPKMGESLDLIKLKETDDATITSCFDCALVEDICPTMNRYIYQALVHGNGLHVCLLEQTSRMLEAEMEEKRIKIKILAEEKVETKMATAATTK